MIQKRLKLLFLLSVIAILLATAINSWMQITTGAVNGTLFWPLGLVVCTLVVLTFMYASYAHNKGEGIRFVRFAIIALFIVALLLNQILTSTYGFSPTGWIF